jgi:hypothetical protein
MHNPGKATIRDLYTAWLPPLAEKRHLVDGKACMPDDPRETESPWVSEYYPR